MPVFNAMAEPVESINANDAPQQLPTLSLTPTVQEGLGGLERQIGELKRQEQSLREEIETLKGIKAQVLQDQLASVQSTLERMAREGTTELERRKQALEIAIEQLERRQERIRAEMRSTFAGTSQELAVRVQGFKDYLVGSLQDLAASAEQLELVPGTLLEYPPESGAGMSSLQPLVSQPPTPTRSSMPIFAEPRFQEQQQRVHQLLELYRSEPDYYGPPWQFRRTFEPVHADAVTSWLLMQGGRGALKSLGSRLQNILVASAALSVLYELYGDRLRALVLANTPEFLGEWRRGLQECLGLSRLDFGPEGGVGLFEDPRVLAQKADRLLDAGDLPLILVDEAEEYISLSLLQFPLWLAFAPDPQASVFL